VGRIGSALYRGAGIGEQLVSKGLADRAFVEEVSRAFEEWGSTPGAFSARAFCEALGTKPQ